MMAQNKNSIKDETVSSYLNIIQNVITRMAQNSFLIKGWFTTIFAAILIITYIYVDKLIIYPILIAITLIFWGLDSYYLRLERLFRKLYNNVVEKFNDESQKAQIKLFDMDFSLFKKKEQHVLRIMISVSEFFFYIIFIVILIILFVLEIFQVF